MSRKGNRVVEAATSILAVFILALGSLFSWLQELFIKPVWSDSDYQKLALFILLLAATGYGLWVIFTAIIRRRRDYEKALVSFGWDPNMTPIDFEHHCRDYLKLYGWVARTTRATGDQGCDVVAEKGGWKVVIQCKKYSQPVGNKAVQEVYAAKKYYQAHAAIVVSNQGYTRSASELARSTDVHLWHFTELRQIDRICSIQKP